MLIALEEMVKRGYTPIMGTNQVSIDLRTEAQGRIEEAIRKATAGRSQSSVEKVTSHSDEKALYQSGANTDTPWTLDTVLIERAKKHFGVTKNVAEFFYILPDGTMLDERKEALFVKGVDSYQLRH